MIYKGAEKSVYRVIAPVPHFNSPTGVTNVDLAEFDDLNKAKEFRSVLMIHSQIVEITK